jgi:hypothetical protein
MDETTMRKDDPREFSRSFRTPDRFFKVNGQWYFTAREGEIGPFRSRGQAEREAAAYIRARQAAMKAGGPRITPEDVRGIPGYVYRCILSMQQPVQRRTELVLERDDD